MKRIVVLLLIFSLLLSCFLTSCQEPTDNSQPESSPEASESFGTPEGNAPTTPTEPVETIPTPDLPEDLNFGNSEVHFISRQFSIYNDELTVEGTTGDPINDAVYKRQIAVEDRLGVEIINNKMSPEGDFGANFDCINKVKSEMMSNAYNYDIMFSPSFACVFRTADCLWEDLLMLEHIDLDREYWSSLYNDQVKIGPRQFFATGPISLSVTRMIYATIFNKTLAEAHNYENLYEVVKENRWTMDYQNTIVKNTYDDIDSIEGASEGDFFGFVSNTNLSTDPYWTVWDVNIFKRTEDNYLEYDFKYERASDFVNKVIDFYWGNESVYLYLPVGEGDEQESIRKHFSDGRAIMAHLKLQELEEEDMRNMTDPYGILPLPKFEENDGPYYSSAFHAFTCVSVLRGQSTIDLEMCGAVLELMACESYNVVQPAYYEIALKGKYSKDEESWQMLDDMVKNFRVDEDFLYSSTDSVDILQQFRSAVYNKNRALGASLQKQDSRLGKMHNMLIGKIRAAYGDE